MLDIDSLFYTAEAVESAERALAELETPDPEDTNLPRLLEAPDEKETDRGVRREAE